MKYDEAVIETGAACILMAKVPQTENTNVISYENSVKLNRTLSYETHIN